jgi:hypothetical protein
MAAFFIGCKFTYSYFFKLNLKFYASILTINNFQFFFEFNLGHFYDIYF